MNNVQNEEKPLKHFLEFNLVIVMVKCEFLLFMVGEFQFASKHVDTLTT